MKILITSPSLDTNKNVSGISSITQFIITYNTKNSYLHFELGRKDCQRRNLSWFINILHIYLKWPYVIFSQKIDIIHFNLALTKESILRDFPLIIMARIFRKSMILHLHGGEFLMHKKNPFWMNYLLKLIFVPNMPLIVLSPLEEKIIKNKSRNSNIYILPNCIDLKEAERYDHDHSNDEYFKFLFLGRISSDKGLEFIYQAMVSLKEKGLKYKFLLAGKGPEEEIFKKKFSDLLGVDFEFKGVVAGIQKTDLLKECDVFLLPSFYEGLPMALLESMSFGLVPITTNVGSIGYVINDGVNGLFVKSHSSDDIVLAIEKLSKYKKYRHELGKNARQTIFTNFNPEHYISRLNKIYNYE
ncbi:MAG TPA: glycosyltransferase family 4 protein [Ignavibacteriaceae bacterium]|nr:glycosyltransferase family 4 protein [Ignavibacteriaceae bacterium]